MRERDPGVFRDGRGQESRKDGTVGSVHRFITALLLCIIGYFNIKTLQISVVFTP